MPLLYGKKEDDGSVKEAAHCTGHRCFENH